MPFSRRRALLPAALAFVPLFGLAGCDDIAGLVPGASKQADTDTAAPGTPRSFAQRPTPAQRLEETGVTKAFMVEAPQTGVDLGWGWSIDRSQTISTACVEFDRHEDPAQETSVSISEVRDSQALSSSMDISSAVSVNAVGYSASGKAKFAKSTNITSFSTTYVVKAEVRNGAYFVQPRAAQRGHVGAAVTLTDAAAALARRDLEAFQGACGEGFVSAQMRGAEAYAVIDIQTRSESSRQSLKTSVQGSGWGVKVDAAFAATSEGGKEKANTNISFYQAGGSGNPLPRDRAEIEARIKDLAKDAQTAPKTYALEITPYQVLENFPRGESLSADAGETDEIAAAWALHRTLYNDITAIFAEPAAFRLPVADCAGAALVSQCAVTFVPVDATPLKTKDADGSAADIAGVSALDLLGVLQDVALLALDRVEIGAQDCLAADEACAFDPTALRSSYAVRAGLPLPAGWLAPADAQVPARMLAAHAGFHLRDPAQGRCAVSSLMAGCIANEEVAGWAARTGFVPLAAADRDAFDRATAALGQTPWLRGDPDRPDALILWVPPAALRAVEAALDGTRLAAR
jgi:hypothetical protein